MERPTMMRFTRSLLAMPLALGALALTGAFAAPPVPETPAPIKRILLAQPITLDQGFEHVWRQEKPMVEGGYLLVLEVNADLVFPRQTAEPVLYVGKQTAQRVSVGYPSGRVVAFVPAPIDEATGAPKLDLAKTPIWFGTPELPEQVDASRIEHELTLAREHGILPRPAEEIEKAQRAGGTLAALPDQDGLMRQAAELMLRFVPDERERAENWLRAAKKDAAGG
jgi:hypothetical protein